MAPIKRSYSADPAPGASGYNWQQSPPTSPTKTVVGRVAANGKASVTKRTASTPMASKVSSPPSNPACSHCRVGRSVDDAIVVCERCSDWSHAACAGTGTDAHYLCARCCQASTTEEDLSPDDPGDLKDYTMSGAHSVPASLSGSPNSFPLGMVGSEYAVGTVAPANLHDAEATYICPVCDIDCTCENKQQARRNSIYAGPVDIYDRPTSKPGSARKTSSAATGGQAPSVGTASASNASSQNGSANGSAAKRQRTASTTQGEEGPSSARKDGSPKKEERIIACTQEGCDKVYTTMAGLRYHLKTFDHAKNRRKDSIDGAGSTAASAAPSTAASPTSSGPSPPSSNTTGATNGSAMLNTSSGLNGGANGMATNGSHGDSNDSPSMESSRAQAAAAAAHEALDAMAASDIHGGRRASMAAPPSAAMVRRASYFSESEDDSYDEDDEDDEVVFSTHASVVSRRHSYPGAQQSTSASSSAERGRRPYLFESTPSASSPIFYPVSPQMLPMDIMPGTSSFSLDFCTPLMASISGDFPAEWDF